MLQYQSGTLHIEKVSAQALAKRYGTPLFAYSKDKLIENYRSFDGAFNGVNHLICYALKANSNYHLLKSLASEGSGVDITSGGELYRALKAGFAPKKIVYAGIGKTAEEIEYALKSGILLFNVESVEELELIGRVARRLKQKAPVAFRINPNVDADTHHHISTGKSGVKFGIPYIDAVDVYKRASKIPSVDVAGIHSHIGSQITSTAPFKLAAERVSGVVNKLAAAGINLRIIDLGGGLGITYKAEKPPTPAQLKSAVLPQFKDFAGTFIFEPGRYIVGNTGVLITSVIYRKQVENKNFIVVNAGMNDLIRPTLYDAYHDIVPVKLSGGKKVRADVVGPICETGDFLGKERLLSWPDQGEFLAVKCAGAYGFAMSSQYNSRLRAAEVMIDGKNSSLIRKREKYEDLVEKEL